MGGKDGAADGTRYCSGHGQTRQEPAADCQGVEAQLQHRNRGRRRWIGDQEIRSENGMIVGQGATSDWTDMDVRQRYNGGTCFCQQGAFTYDP